MKILVCVKYVPDATDEVSFEEDQTLARTGGSGRLSELDEYAVEQALQLRAELADATVTVLTVGSDDAEIALRKALQMGANDAVLVTDPAIAGSDVFGTATVLASAARSVGEVGLVMCGMSSTDAGIGVLPALLADALGWPLLSQAAALTVDGQSLQIDRVDETGSRTIIAGLPAVVSVTDQSGEPRYPSFKDVLAAKKKQVTKMALADLGVSPDSVGLAAARVEVIATVRNPDRAAGRVIVDDNGSSVDEIVKFLVDATK
jgi:electron transfer flavoprotein beta subunit